uniref:ATP synthase F(1) complex subunit delta, mitochondrial n=1 Tax=Varanus komodoensis TaxID=61221 RepID=A0A8D2Q4G8_VARKO
MLPASRVLARTVACRSRGPARRYAEAAAAAAGGPAQMSFTFASPSQVFYNAANVKQVDVPTLSGSFGILASHVPTLQVLKPGVVTVFAEDGSSTKYFVSSGSVTVNADSSVQLLAEEVALLDQLDATVRAPFLSGNPRPGLCCSLARDAQDGFCVLYLEALGWGWGGSFAGCERVKPCAKTPSHARGQHRTFPLCGFQLLFSLPCS